MSSHPLFDCNGEDKVSFIRREVQVDGTQTHSRHGSIVTLHCGIHFFSLLNVLTGIIETLGLSPAHYFTNFNGLILTLNCGLHFCSLQEN